MLSASPPRRFGSGRFQYELVEGWGTLPEGWLFGQVAAVAVDSRDNVYAFHRGMHPIVVFDRDGNVTGGWGDGVLAQAHGMYIDREDRLFLVDRGAHTIEIYQTDGTRIGRIGERFQPAPKYSLAPFNMPQGVATAPNGDVYVADGKCNYAVHRFTASGEHVCSWGGKGSGPGEFLEPHGVWVIGDDRIMVADRANDRIQYFDPSGAFIREWTGLSHPDFMFIDGDGNIYVTEIEGARISIFAPDETLITSWGGVMSKEPGQFWGPHGVWLDSHGDMYISEVQHGKRVQKFRRLRDS